MVGAAVGANAACGGGGTQERAIDIDTDGAGTSSAAARINPTGEGRRGVCRGQVLRVGWSRSSPRSIAGDDRVVGTALAADRRRGGTPARAAGAGTGCDGLAHALGVLLYAGAVEHAHLQRIGARRHVGKGVAGIQRGVGQHGARHRRGDAVGHGQRRVVACHQAPGGVHQIEQHGVGGRRRGRDHHRDGGIGLRGRSQNGGVRTAAVDAELQLGRPHHPAAAIVRLGLRAIVVRNHPHVVAVALPRRHAEGRHLARHVEGRGRDPGVVQPVEKADELPARRRVRGAMQLDVDTVPFGGGIAHRIRIAGGVLHAVVHVVAGDQHGIGRGAHGQGDGVKGDELARADQSSGGRRAVHVGAGGDDDRLRRGHEQLPIIVEHRSAESDAAFDPAAARLKCPVPAERSGAGRVTGGRHVGSGHPGQRAHQRLTVGTGADIATVQQQVGSLGQMGLPGSQRARLRLQICRPKGLLAEQDFPVGAMRHDVNGREILVLGDHRAHLLPRVLPGRQRDHQDARAHIGHKGLVIGHAGIDEDDLVRVRQGRRCWNSADGGLQRRGDRAVRARVCHRDHAGRSLHQRVGRCVAGKCCVHGRMRNIHGASAVEHEALLQRQGTGRGTPQTRAGRGCGCLGSGLRVAGLACAHGGLRPLVIEFCI